MTDSVILVTDPDDVQVDGLRLLLVDLNIDQNQIVSDALARSDGFGSIVSYIWRSGDSVDWLLDKKHKSDLIIFNADSENDIIIGYMAAQKYSYYFGILKILSPANNRNIYNADDVTKILNLTL
jgi:hypothetical protein